MIHKKEIKFFDDNGYLFIDKFIKKNIITGIKSEISKTLKKIGKDSKNFEVLYEDDGSIRLVRNIHDNIEFFKNLVVSSSLIEIAKSLLKSDVYVLNSKLNIKSAFTGGHFDWHQDYGYWYNNGCLFPHLASCMIAVDQATVANGCLQVLKGSHLMGRIEHERVGDQTGASLERVEVARQRLELVHCELEAGSAVFFHCNLLHRSDQNKSEKPRWAFICCCNYFCLLF